MRRLASLRRTGAVLTQSPILLTTVHSFLTIRVNMARFVSSLSFALLLAVFEIGSCLRCYQCNSQSDPTCGDPFTAYKYLVDCSDTRSVNYNLEYLSQILPQELLHGTTGAPRYCHKIVMQNGATVRTCLDANPNDLNQTCRLLDGISRNIPLDRSKQLKHCSVCDKDSCNAAGSITASAPLALLALVASYLYYKL